MKAVVYHDVGDIRIDEVPEPKITELFDAIVRITTSAICRTDLHFIRDGKSFDKRESGWIKIILET